MNTDDTIGKLILSLLLFIFITHCFAFANNAYNSNGVVFTENIGQWPDSIKFRADSKNATLWFTPNGVYYQLLKTSDCNPTNIHDKMLDLYKSGPDSIETQLFKAEFSNCKHDVIITGQNELDYKCNYFLGNNPDNWRTNVTSYRSIVFKDIYEGVDISFEGVNGVITYQYDVSAETDISSIGVSYIGIDDVYKDNDGRMVAKSNLGLISGILSKPSSKEMISERVFLEMANGPDVPREVPATRGENSIGLVYSTLLGGSNYEYAFAIDVDDSGFAYITGYTYSVDFPTLNPIQDVQVLSDVYVFKLSRSGDELIYSTYLGGSDNDQANGIAVDKDYSVYITGRTSSDDYPTINPFQTNQVYDDVFVTKLSPNGDGIEYSTYIGGGSDDKGNSIAVDSTGSAYIAGLTLSPEYPLLNPYQSDQPDADAFVTKLSPLGNSLEYSTYIGGSNGDVATSIVVDDKGNAYITGTTTSIDYPVMNPAQTYNADIDIIVSKLSPEGNDLVYSTYLGGDMADIGKGIAIDDENKAYIIGCTNSSDYPLVNPLQELQGEEDILLTILSTTGDDIEFSTAFGGSDPDYGLAIDVDSDADIFIAGHTVSMDFPIKNPYQYYQGGGDGFITRISPKGENLVYSTYLGGSSYDNGFSDIAVDSEGSLYIAGFTRSADFPLVNSIQELQGSHDIFVSKFPSYLCGDADGDWDVDIIDIIMLIVYKLKNGPEPGNLQACDADGNGLIDLQDIIILIAYEFKGDDISYCY